MAEKKYKIAITTGDTLGIGEEITIKALNALKLPSEEVLIIGKNLNDCLLDTYDTIELDTSDNGRFCFNTLKTASDLANEGVIQAIVTAPVSKEALFKSGFHYSGQTEILQELLGNKDSKAEMLFFSYYLRVLLLTRHIPLNQVKLSKNLIIEKSLRVCKFLVQKCGIESPKLALCALNPHAGENGILGDDEIEIMTPAVLELRDLGVDITFPLSADGLFAGVGEKYLNGEKQYYDCILAAYHDQGLCPIKALCFKKAVNTTIGLKVIRTSPSSGTAYDIAGQGIADATGMAEAIKLALQLA